MIPSLQQLSHVPRITPPPKGATTQPPPSFPHNVSQQSVVLLQQPTAMPNISTPVPIGVAFLPVSPKLVAKIESGAFIEMAELIPQRLGNVRGYLSEEQGPTTPKKRSVTSTLEWIQCFSIYIAIISNKQPERVPDLLRSYQE